MATKKSAVTGASSKKVTKKTVKKAAKSAAVKTAATKAAPRKTSALSGKKAAASKAGKKTASAADAVDEQLARYRSMRDFGVTAEPSGSEKAKGAAGRGTTANPSALPFVIQKHAASHLHYDFRLGWNGVLKSWAVAKGPSYVTADKRLAVQVEDHPMEYGGFEGIIPKGQYGGGTVMVWDQGTWEPQEGHTDVDAGLRDGSLKFIMHGTKMKGKWALIRMGGRAARESKPNWLLIKEHDEFERKPTDPAITEEKPNSAVTGRDLEQIARHEDHVWNSKETAQGNAWYRKDVAEDESARGGEDAEEKPKAAVSSKVVEIARPAAAKDGQDMARGKNAKRGAKTAGDIDAMVQEAPKEKLPAFFPPQLAQSADTPPTSAGWLHELKLDGYRIQARKSGGDVQLLTRNGLDWTHRMPTIAKQVAALPVEQAILDGEVVVLAENGTTSFADLQAAFQEGVKKPLTYFVFDLLHADGKNLRGMQLVERKAVLAALLEGAGEWVRLSEHIETDGAVMFRKTCELGAEGIISKRAASTYRSGRSSEWLKLKCVYEQELVIGGFTLPSNGIHGVGALLLGYYVGNKLIYAGRTGTGFTEKTHRILRNKLEDLRAKECPFEAPPAEARRGAHWVKPELVAQVKFATWTADNLVRQASFKGLREDKAAKEVRRESAAAAGSEAASGKGGAAKTAEASHHVAAGIAAKAHAVDAAPHAVKKVAAKKAVSKSDVGTAPVRLTHPEKVYDAETQLTKQQLADYYWAVAEHMLPHIAGRPLSLVRCPEGSGGECFFQKHVNHMLPPGVVGVDVPNKKTGVKEPYITLSTAEALAGLAQMGVLEVHPWGSRNDDLERPDRIIIDLDPDEAIGWEQLGASAVEIKKRFAKIGLESFLKSTGGKGLHVVVPFEPELDWDAIKQFTHDFVLAMEKAEPALYLTKMSKAARKGKIFLDYLRNERGATAVAAFSPRARVGAPVSLPMGWNELKGDRPVARLAEFDGWKARLKKDPWVGMGGVKQRITKEMLKG